MGFGDAAGWRSRRNCRLARQGMGYRQTYIEGAPLVEFAFDPYPAAVSFHNPPANRETQAGPLVLARHDAIGLLEFLENPPLRLRWNPSSEILNPQEQELGIVRHGLGADPHDAPRS